MKFVSIPTVDQNRALELATDQDMGTERWIELRIGGSDTRIVLFTMDGEPKPGGTFNGALACDSVERTYDELRNRGVEFLRPPQRQPWGTFATFKDVDGNQLVLSSRRDWGLTPV